MSPVASSQRIDVVANFWDAAEETPGFEEALGKFRAMIRSSQQPQACSNTCRVHHKLWVGGTASNLRRLAHVLLNAVLANCALVGRYPPSQALSVSTGALMLKRCSDPGRHSLQCYFLPISTCSKETSATKVPEISYGDISKNLDTLANRTGLRSEVLAMGTLLAWIMRPQPELAEAVDFYGGALGFKVPGGRHRRVGMHIRKGDKHSLYPKHLKNHTFRVSVQSFSIWGRRIASDLGAEGVLYLTDDRGATETLGQNAPFFQLAPAPAECMPSYNAGILGKAYVRAAIALNKLRNERFAAAEAERANQSHLCGPDHFRDDGIQLFAGMLLLSQCGSFIGTQISNIDSVVVELMATLRHPPVYFDLLNDVHRPWASDEKVWYGGVHTHTRPVSAERLVNDDGSWTQGVWM